MPGRLAPLLHDLSEQLRGIFRYYQHMLDDEFVFASATQVPQAATIFDATAGMLLPFGAKMIGVPDLLAFIAYRYGFTRIRRVGHGGYSVVLGHQNPDANPALRRVLRLVPDHHVQDVTGWHRPFDVRLDDANEPLRDPNYPLILSDLFVLPRHTTKLIFHNADGEVIQAAGKPAILHCQLLPEVIPLNAPGLDQGMAREAGNLLWVAMSTLGVSVADAHGGNGGVLVGADGQPMTFQPADADHPQYVPVVIDYGYYSEIGAKSLAGVLRRNGVTLPMIRQALDCPVEDEAQLIQMIQDCGAEKQAFGRLLYDVEPRVLFPEMWIQHSERHWETTKEKSYPPLHDQARLNIIYPVYDEILFPQRIEEYHIFLYEI